jgi:3-hydroxy-D-aspartate aldolase
VIEAEPGLKFMGLQAYEGRAQHLNSYSERKTAIEKAAQSTRISIDAIVARGLACQIVGGGGTGTYTFEGGAKLWTELQCGSYIFMDGEYSAIAGKNGGPYADFEQSLFVLATVMSIAGEGRAVVDAGLKSYTLEKGLPNIFDQINAKIVSVSDEHGTLVFEGERRLSLGAKLKLVPSHCDPTVNLHDTFVCVRGNRVKALWPINARGCSA